MVRPGSIPAWPHADGLQGRRMSAGAMLALAVLATLAAAVAIIDIRSMIIPDPINLALFVTGLAACLALKITDPAAALVAAVLALGCLLGLRAGFRAMRGYDGLGLGDIKFIAAAVCWTGAEGLPVALLTSSVAALAYVSGRRAWDADFDVRRRVPFGPFLALGVVAVGGLQIVIGRSWLDLVSPYLA